MIRPQPLQNRFAAITSKRYYKHLSKITSGLPSRITLAFFVPVNCNTSQVIQRNSTAHLDPLRVYTVYDGLTLPNKRAERRISKAASSDAESKTRHPFLSVALTQKSLGVSRNG